MCILLKVNCSLPFQISRMMIWQLSMVVQLSLSLAEQMYPEEKTLGENLIVTFEGDTSRGCRITQRLPGSEKNFCCFSAEVRGETLCAPGYDHSCREHAEFTVEENQEKCVLTFQDFRCSDEGTYTVKFPKKLSDNKDIKVSSLKGACETSIVSIIVGCVVLSILGTLSVVLVIYFFVVQKKKVGELCCGHIEAQCQDTNSFPLQTPISLSSKRTVPRHNQELNQVLRFVKQCESREVIQKLKKTDLTESELGICLKAAQEQKSDCYKLSEMAKTMPQRKQQALREEAIQSLNIIIQVLESKLTVTNII